MTEDKQGRRYFCICGREFVTYDELKAHWVNDHHITVPREG